MSRARGRHLTTKQLVRLVNDDPDREAQDEPGCDSRPPAKLRVRTTSRGPVYITGSDPYDLDRDGDGVACEDQGKRATPAGRVQPVGDAINVLDGPTRLARPGRHDQTRRHNARANAMTC